jgi:8-oxo-dGTP pyrophosphatase MutT (NUDIX family)
MLPMDLSRERFASALAANRPSDPWDILVEKRAAVAAVLRFTPNGAEVLLMERAARAGDRWSGQVSFPGGREEPHDESLLDTAIRETLEEVGLDLRTHATHLGRLDGRRAVAKGAPLSMTITPHVFALEREPTLLLSDEARTAFWMPLVPAARGDFDDVYPYEAGPVTMNLSCWRYEGHVVWGMTFEMIRGLLKIVA